MTEVEGIPRNQLSLEKAVDGEFGVQRYTKYSNFVIKMSRWSFLDEVTKVDKLKEYFIECNFVKFTAGFLYLVCPSEKSFAMRNIAQVYKTFKLLFGAVFENNLDYIKGSVKICDRVRDFFDLWGELKFKVGNPELTNNIDFSAGAKFCMEQEVFECNRLLTIFTRLQAGCEISPDKRRQKEYDPAAVLAQRQNAIAVLTSNNPLGHIKTIIQMAQNLRRDEFEKKSCAEILLDILKQHQDCCCRDIGFDNCIKEPGIINFLEHNEIDPNYFFMCLVNVFLHKTKARRNLFLFSLHKDVGKTTLALHIGKLLPDVVVGSLNFSKWQRSSGYLLHHVKNKHIGVTDDVTDTDLIELEDNCDMLDGIIRKSANSKFGSLDLVTVCPQIFTSNTRIKWKDRLTKRIEEFEFIKETNLAEYIDYPDIPCGLISGILNYFVFYKLQVKTKKVNTWEERKATHKKQADFVDCEFHNPDITFRKGVQPMADKVTISLQGESFSFYRKM